LGGTQPPAQAIDERTVEYRFAEPTWFAPSVLAMPQFAPAPAHWAGDADRPVLGGYLPTRRTETELVLCRNPAYEPGPGSPESLTFRLTATNDEALREYRDGGIDITPATSFGRTELADLAGRGDLVSGDLMLFGSLEFGHRAGELATSARLRGALGRLLRRAQVSATTGGATVEWWSQVQPWQAGGGAPGPDTVGGDDLAELRTVCRDGLCIDYADFVPNGDVVDEVAAQLRDVLGVPVSTAGHSFDEYLKLVIGREHCLLYTLTGPDFPHPAAMLSSWTSTGGQARHAGFADADFDERVARARDCADPAEALNLWADADRRWCELMPRVPLLQVRAHCLASPRLAGLAPAVDGTLTLRELVIVDD
ncbi:MAG: ABC transporter substrate-binding protein, partial [Actinocatenispora sp.]